MTILTLDVLDAAVILCHMTEEEATASAVPELPTDENSEDEVIH